MGLLIDNIQRDSTRMKEDVSWLLSTEGQAWLVVLIPNIFILFLELNK